MFDRMKELMEMQKKMQELKRELENTNFEVSSSDGLVKITMNGAQEVKEVSLSDESLSTERSAFEKAIKDAFNRSIKRAQEVAAEKMKRISGLNLPGM